ncbi:transcriptional repressor [Roseovarius sp. A-2]|uniref:transcriptional repressor n=1 Tax=Roseovarius sp. A-2 TaxID=1570360 RepID=UPI0009B51EFA
MTDVSRILTQAGIRPTRQRAALGKVLWSDPDLRQVEAAALDADLIRTGVKISLATVCNALRDFEHAGLIRKLAVASPWSPSAHRSSDCL